MRENSELGFEGDSQKGRFLRVGMREQSGARGAANVHMGANAVERGWRIELTIVPPGEYVVANEPAHAGPDNDIRRKVPAHGKSRCADGGSQRVRRDWHDQRARIFMR